MAKGSDLNKVTSNNHSISFEPKDYSDVGQAQIFVETFGDRVCFCEGLGWLTYEDGFWVRSDNDAHGYAQDLTDLQFAEATDNRRLHLMQGNVSTEKDDNYMRYIIVRRASARIKATLEEAKPLVGITPASLDADPLILNTPGGEVHLDTGEMAPHDPTHYITHITALTPSTEGHEIWAKFLDQISCGDETIADFLQQIAGMAAIGKVYEERLIIAVGSGGNGKSTFFNAIQDVLGDYAGTIRSELLIASNDSGKKFEYASLRGRRFIIAEELEEGKQLDTAAVKHLCSTGDINAQYKGKDIFTFKPSHSMVLCTNHMPSVKTADNGTWDRLIVVPFNGRFRNQATEIKNYGAYLVENCGGAILSWIIEGAQKYIQNDYKLIIPVEIRAAMKRYQEENDWATDFFKVSLVFEPGKAAKGSELYDAYKQFCQESGIQPLPSSVVLPRIAQQPGVKKTRTSKGTCYTGVGIDKPEPTLFGGVYARKCRAKESIPFWDELFPE